MTTTVLGGKPTQVAGRVVEGIVVPYDELSHLTPNPAGERVMRGAFTGSIEQPGKIFLFKGHDHSTAVGRAISFREDPAGLVGVFEIRSGPAGDSVLQDLEEGYLPAMSVGFRPLEVARGTNGETVLVRGQLMEVSLVNLGAYESARVFALRAAQQAGAPIASLPLTQPPVPEAQRMQWHVPAHLRSLVDLDGDGRLRDVPAQMRRPPFVGHLRG